MKRMGNKRILMRTVLMLASLSQIIFLVESFSYSPRLSSHIGVGSSRTGITWSGKNRRYSKNRSQLKMAVIIPEISDWEITKRGGVNGIVKNHPSIENGDTISTSPLSDPSAVGPGKVVMTITGSRYKLKGLGKSDKSSDKSSSKNPLASIFSWGTNSLLASDSTTTTTTAPVPTTPTPTLKKNEYQGLILTGQTVGDGKYLIAGKPNRSTSGKSNIYSAFRADRDGNPVGNLLTVKITPNSYNLQRENKNYNKITNGIFGGSFVQKLEFLPEADPTHFPNQSALVIEAGVKDLKQLLNQRWGRGLDGRAMRDAAAAAGSCIQAMHSSKMVWTDLKTENFVLTKDLDGEDSLFGFVKGIDLESARPYGRNPVDYSPEACPPEFADAFVSGNGADFVLKPSYDMWSLGMMLYELATGQPYFASRNALQITKVLRTPGFQVDVSKVPDEKLRDLIGQCLSLDPRKRPGITQFLLHPYFTTTGIGAYSF